MIYTEKPEGFMPDHEGVGCFLEVQGYILMLLRNSTAKIEPEKWGTPAGKMEPGETPGQAMVRELREETGLIIAESQLQFLRTFFVDFAPPKFRYHVFRLSIPHRPTITRSNEHIAFCWTPPWCCKTLSLMKDQWDCTKYIYGFTE